MRQVAPSEIFKGTVVVVAPHMDDCVLACGGSIAGLVDRSRVHMVYATDGTKAPEPELTWRDRTSPDLGKIRCQEARSAMDRLGLPPANVHFLGFPDGDLRQRSRDLGKALFRFFRECGAQRVLTPFRFDRHPDHLVVNRVVTEAVLAGNVDVELYEYFVYHHWKLLPGGDVRNFIGGDGLRTVDISSESHVKLEALGEFRTQTTRFYPWQSRPNLTQALIQQVSSDPEVFLRFEREYSGARILTGPVTWIRIAHRLEPFLKRRKDRTLAMLRRLLLPAPGRLGV
jgi:LmbE family N-acetylglucosaminyl deacetylase